jgi:disulfide oxidoreductase YuzD
LRASETITRKAKDILRASRLPLLDQDNVHVQSNLEKIKNKKKLSPVLLVAGETLIIADGYHRLCAIYFLSEDLDVPCRLIHPDEISK